MRAPSISVLMSVWNGLPYVRESVESILQQTFSDFEFIVIDDASTDGAAAALADYDDPRLRIYRQPRNVGLTRSLNLAISMARGKYLARTDADDTSDRTRLEKQVAFMNLHPEVALIGSFCRCVGNESRIEEWVYPTEDAAIRSRLARKNQFVHSSVMIRRSAIAAVGSYDEAFLYVQDYELWGRLAARFQVANLPEYLVTRRIRADALSQRSDCLWARFRAHAMAQLAVARRLNRPLDVLWLIEHALGYAKRVVMRQCSSFRGRTGGD